MRPLDELRVATWRLPHCTTPQLEAVARLGATSGKGTVATLAGLRDELGLDQLYYLATCQRVLLAFRDPAGEVTPEKLWQQVSGRLGWETPPVGPPEFFGGEAAFAHLCEVASSLDSLVPGEPQVLGQFKEAYHTCKQAGLAGPELERWLPKVLRVAKRVRSRTKLFTGSVSLIPLTSRFIQEAVSEARRGCGQVAVVGTGPIGQALLAKLSRHPGLQLYCVSHRRERAEEVSGEALPLSLAEFLAEPPCLDGLALATRAEEPFLGLGQVERIMARRCPGHPGSGLRVLDLAMPRNARPEIGELEGVRLVQMDDLVELAEQGRESRRAALTQAREVLAKELALLRRERWKAAHRERIMALRGSLEAAAKERLASFPGDARNPKVKRWMEQTLKGLIHVAQTQMLEALERTQAPRTEPSANSPEAARTDEDLDSQAGPRRRGPQGGRRG